MDAAGCPASVSASASASGVCGVPPSAHRRRAAVACVADFPPAPHGPYTPHPPLAMDSCARLSALTLCVHDQQGIYTVRQRETALALPAVRAPSEAARPAAHQPTSRPTSACVACLVSTLCTARRPYACAGTPFGRATPRASLAGPVLQRDPAGEQNVRCRCVLCVGCCDASRR